MELVIKPTKNHSLNLHELWQYRELLYFLVWRDIKVRYKQTLIGIFWAILQPLLTMVIFTIVFNRIGGISSGKLPYAVFSFTGLLFWNYFSTSINDASLSLVGNQSIITKVFFPRILIPIASSITPLIDFLFSFLILFILMLFYHTTPQLLGLLLLLPLLILTTVAAASLGIILSIINVKYRDVRYALPFFIQLMLFVTPVIYPLQKIPHNLQLVLFINPLTGVIDTIRSALFATNPINWTGLAISIASSLVMAAVALQLYKTYEQQLADII